MSADPAQAAPRPEAPRVIAVLDIGATALRMEIAEVQGAGATRTLDSLHRPVALGRDAFTLGYLQRETIEECVQALRQFRAVLHEYGIVDMRSVRAVATSAVREARNRDRFLDRVRMATGIPVDCIDELELSRLTYLAARHVLTRAGVRRPWHVLVLEVGGGSTEVLLLRDDRVVFADTFPLGSLRIQETLETDYATPRRRRELIEQGIERTLNQMRRRLAPPVPALLVMSGDARFAARYLAGATAPQPLARLRPADLGAFAGRLLDLSPDEIVRNYRLTYPEAESVGPALQACSRIAAVFKVRHILVPEAHLRTALELDMSADSVWTEDFRAQIEHAALALAIRFEIDLRHARHVARTAALLFDALVEDHGLTQKHAVLLRTAALLHEAGLFVNSSNHHTHSMYLIQHSDLFGLSRRDLLLVALMARYHRRATPQPDHPYYSQLDPDERLTVQKLAALLRIACALDRGHEQRIRDPEIVPARGRLEIRVRDREDLSMERLALNEKGAMFEEVYGRTLALTAGPVVREADAHV